MASSNERFPPTASCEATHIATAVLAGFVWVTLGARFISHRLKAVPIGLDECLLVLAGLGVTASTTIFGFLIRTGIGYHINDPRWDTIRAANAVLEAKLYFAFEILYTVNTGLAKTSALLFFIRVFPTASMRKASYISIGGIGILTAVFLLISLLACRPISANWTFELRNNASCIDRKPSFIVSCVATIVTDFLILGLPIWPIWNLKTNRSTKVKLIFIFVAGIVVTIFSIVRLHFIIKVDYAFDFTGTSQYAIFFTAFEPGLMIICISLPMIYSLFPKHSQKSGDSRSKSQDSRGFLDKVGWRRHKGNEYFVPIDESDPTHHRSRVVIGKGSDRESVEMWHETIIVQETFTVSEEPARSGVPQSGVAQGLPTPYSAVAWSEGKHAA
ncbi:hypothetical protein F4777DRAFT_532589 [Nemania sp. FL0916]|nr:hypothetical protein F4777DRAFT_532589 [Nemania sp. FL0916]